MVPTSGFEMLIAAGWLRVRYPVSARLTRKGVRAACREFWAAGWSNLDVTHALDHLPAAFGARAGTPIGRGPGDGLDSDQAWWWIQTRLAAWRDADGRPLRGYYQTRSRRGAARAALIARHGRAALRVLPDPDLSGDQVLTPEQIERFGRRVAAELRARAPRPAPAAPAATSAGAPPRPPRSWPPPRPTPPPDERPPTHPRTTLRTPPPHRRRLPPRSPLPHALTPLLTSQTKSTPMHYLMIMVRRASAERSPRGPGGMR
jgi:hypothetical protein